MNKKVLCMWAVGLVFSGTVILTTVPFATADQSARAPSGTIVERTLKTASDKAAAVGLDQLAAPFRRPFQYVGMTLAEAEKLTGGKLNQVRKIIIDNDKAHMLLETEGNFISYVDVELKQTEPCNRSIPFNSEPILGALSINPSELDLVKKNTHNHNYYDHNRKLKVSVYCDFDGHPLAVGFSSKYYGM